MIYSLSDNAAVLNIYYTYLFAGRILAHFGGTSCDMDSSDFDSYSADELLSVYEFHKLAKDLFDT